jgi:broad specificity phosphatase PhoE
MPVLVIGHQAVNRCLLAYFRNKVHTKAHPYHEEE